MGITRGNIIEEDHYYAYGLKIAAISSRKAGDVNDGKLKNGYLYNDKELFDDADLNWYDYGFRNYDAQIGRFVQLDPLTDEYPFLAPYQYASCDPITNIDIDGLEGGSAVIGLAGDFLESTKGINQAAVFVTAVRAVKTVETATSISRLALSITSIAIQSAITTVNIINNGITTSTVVNPQPSNQQKQGWKDLDKATLLRYAATQCPSCTPGQLQNFTGDLFEEGWHNSALATNGFRQDHYRVNNTKMSGGTQNTVPDATADGIIQTSFFKQNIVVPEGAWFEVKAKSGDIYNSTSAGQIMGHITNLAAKVPWKYRFYGTGTAKASAASLTFITTSDVRIAVSVTAAASTQNIILYHYKAEYLMQGNLMEVRFKLSSTNAYGNVNFTTAPVILR